MKAHEQLLSWPELSQRLNQRLATGHRRERRARHSRLAATVGERLPTQRRGGGLGELTPRHTLEAALR